MVSSTMWISDLEPATVFLGVTSLLVLLMYIAIKFVFASVTVAKRIPGAKNVLLVIAHPDDECMFFGPLLVALAKSSDIRLNVLCLSTGNYEGFGPTRKQELWNSCKLLGIPEAHITCADHSRLPDNPDIGWRSAHISSLLMQNVIGLQIDTLITFDDHGVSGHLNHISIRNCVDDLIEKQSIPQTCRVFSLESVNWFRKYILGVFDVYLSYATSEFMYVADTEGTRLIKAAMKAHASQYVWFRKLYMWFSRYARINTFQELKLSTPPGVDINDTVPKWARFPVLKSSQQQRKCK